MPKVLKIQDYSATKNMDFRVYRTFVFCKNKILFRVIGWYKHMNQNVESETCQSVTTNPSVFVFLACKTVGNVCLLNQLIKKVKHS